MKEYKLDRLINRCEIITERRDFLQAIINEAKEGNFIRISVPNKTLSSVQFSDEGLTRLLEVLSEEVEKMTESVSDIEKTIEKAESFLEDL